MHPRRIARPLLSLTIAIAAAGCAAAPAWTMDDERRAALDRVLDAAVASGRIPGAVALVTTADAVVYRRACGMLDPASGAAMTPDAIFDVASMTKPITSVGVMMLVEEGRIGLDDPASRHLPELADRAVLVRVDPSTGALETRPPMREPTIRDLLRHTSGIGYSFCSPELRDVERFAKVPDREQPLLHDPGARWTYGMGTAQLGWIIENVTGMPLAEFLRARVLAPLEMPDTSFGLPPEKAARMVTLHRRRNGVLVASPRREPFVDGGRGDGDLLSTADDYAHFMQMILGHGRRGDVRLLDAATVSEMTRDQLDGLVVVEQPDAMPSLAAPFPLGAGRDGFGLGFQVAVDGADGRPDDTLSWAGLYNTHFWIDPATGIGVVLLFQILPFYDPAVIDVLREFERAVYGRQLGAGAPPDGR